MATCASRLYIIFFFLYLIVLLQQQHGEFSLDNPNPSFKIDQVRKDGSNHTHILQNTSFPFTYIPKHPDRPTNLIFW